MARDARTLYRELVEHGTKPRNEGPLERATHEATTTNPLCGDRITLRLRVEDGVVRAARFEARGCMIARASASVLTDAIGGGTVENALELAARLRVMVGDAPATDVPAEVGSLEPLLGVRQFPARRGCVLLPWEALELSGVARR